MDYKEKLRLAKEALISSSFDKDTIEYIFPELKESEDERIRKMLIGIYKKADIGGAIFGEGITYKQVVTWLEKQGEKFQYWKPSEEQLEALDYAYNSCPDTERGNYYEGVLKTLIDDLHKLLEKQGEQKPADKVEPKFYEGDWIISDTVNKDYHICKIIGIKDGNYTIESIYGYKGYNQFDEFDNVYRLWTIQDAKDGNVLKEDSCTFIIERMKPNGTAVIHCCLFDDGDFDLGSTLSFNVDSTYPATKEQRDTLERAMTNAGYRWNKEELKLEKI